MQSAASLKSTFHPRAGQGMPGRGERRQAILWEGGTGHSRSSGLPPAFMGEQVQEGTYMLRGGQLEPKQKEGAGGQPLQTLPRPETTDLELRSRTGCVLGKELPRSKV